MRDNYWIKLVKEWSHTVGLLVVATSLITSIVYASRTLVTKDEMESGLNNQTVLFNRSQEAQEKYLQEYIMNAASAASDKAAEKTIRKWIEIVGIRNSRTAKYFKDQDDE